MEGKSKSQIKRASYDYRREYFKRNPGIYGCVWFCAYCGKPLFGKKQVEVDHVVPLAGMGINRTINTVAACRPCNRKKSDKGGMYAVEGSFGKVFETFLFTMQKIIMIQPAKSNLSNGLPFIVNLLLNLIRGIITVFQYIAVFICTLVSIILYSFIRLGLKIVSAIVRSKNPIIQLTFIAIAAIVLVVFVFQIRV